MELWKDCPILSFNHLRFIGTLIIENMVMIIVDVAKIVPIVSACFLTILELLLLDSLMLIFLRKSMLFLRDVKITAILAINSFAVVIDLL